MRRVFLLIALCLASPAAAAPEESLIRVTVPNGTTILAELADTPIKRAQGLMFRDSLAKDRGMLFTFTEAQPWTFWMKNTRISLDIIWLDGKQKVVDVRDHVPICTRTDEGCPQYQPTQPAMFVLELGAGMAERLGLRKGAAVKFQMPEPKSGR